MAKPSMFASSHNKTTKSATDIIIILLINNAWLVKNIQWTRAKIMNVLDNRIVRANSYYCPFYIHILFPEEKKNLQAPFEFHLTDRNESRTARRRWHNLLRQCAVFLLRRPATNYTFSVKTHKSLGDGSWILYFLPRRWGWYANNSVKPTKIKKNVENPRLRFFSITKISEIIFSNFTCLFQSRHSLDKIN